LTLPAVSVSSSLSSLTYLRWTRNVMHNIVRECNISFNDLVAARFDNYHLDFWAAFTVPASKQNGYNNMIGNIDPLTQPSDSLPSATLNLPLPFFYGRDSGVALPTAALPYNEMRINFSFRDWNNLLIADVDDGNNVITSKQAVESQLANGAPVISNCQVWANYAIVSNDERKRMACAPRDILVEQVQTAPRQTFNPSSSGNPQPSYDIRFSHAIKVLFFSVRNTSNAAEWSNYSTVAPVVDMNNKVVDFTPSGAADPIIQTSLIYENTNRLSQMGSDYFSLVNPWFSAPTIPSEIGYHAYSYSLDFISLDPMGSTNYGKLTNVSIVPEASESAKTQANNSGTLATPGAAQKYEFIITAVNNNILRVSGGALGFPVL